MELHVTTDALFDRASDMLGAAATEAEIVMPRFREWSDFEPGAAYSARFHELFLARAFAETQTLEALRVVIAHEVGHARQRGITLASRRVSIVSKVAVGFLFMMALCHALSWLGWACSVAICACWLGFVVGPFAMWKEIDADRFAARHVRSARSVVRALLRTYRDFELECDWRLRLRVLVLLKFRSI
jgi:hypothetical protein